MASSTQASGIKYWKRYREKVCEIKKWTVEKIGGFHIIFRAVEAILVLAIFEDSF